MNKAGELLVSSEVSRSQHRNLSDCLQKISTILAEASEKPHEPTAEDVALRAARYCPPSPVHHHQSTITTLTRPQCLCLSQESDLFQVEKEERRTPQTEKDPFRNQTKQKSGL